MTDKKNIILAFGNKQFNNALIELRPHLNFNLKVISDLYDDISIENCQGVIIHEDVLDNDNLKNIITNVEINKIIFHESKKIKGFENIEKLSLPTSVDQINKIIVNNIIKNKFRINSALRINDYVLNKNSRKLIKKDISMELTEKEIELIELLKSKSYTKKKEILTRIWQYSDQADTHTVETHIYRLRKKIKEKFNDETFIKSEKKGYTI
tara:strand:- start:312 stop:941 length:630 start_codon:yes stop_codon:yes gene_type:complete